MLELYVSGTEENSGKTFITAGLAATMQCLGYSTCVYKPIQTNAIKINGTLKAPDLDYIRFVDPYIKTYYSYLFENNGAPVVAAEASSVEIKENKIFQEYETISRNYECIITDGMSGLSTPLAKKFQEEDIIKQLNLPLLLVVSPTKTSVNNIIMTINYARSQNISVRGVILNDYPDDTIDLTIKALPRLIEEYTSTKVLGTLPHIENLTSIDPNDLITNILYGIDLESVFNVKIAKLS